MYYVLCIMYYVLCIMYYVFVCRYDAIIKQNLKGIMKYELNERRQYKFKTNLNAINSKLVEKVDSKKKITRKKDIDPLYKLFIKENFKGNVKISTIIDIIDNNKGSLFISHFKNILTEEIYNDYVQVMKYNKMNNLNVLEGILDGANAIMFQKDIKQLLVAISENDLDMTVDDIEVNIKTIKENLIALALALALAVAVTAVSVAAVAEEAVAAVAVAVAAVAAVAAVILIIITITYFVYDFSTSEDNNIKEKNIVDTSLNANTSSIFHHNSTNTDSIYSTNSDANNTDLTLNNNNIQCS